MGARWGRSCLICSTSNMAVSVIVALLARLGEARQRVNLPGPFSYRFRGSAAIILPAFQEKGGAGARPRAHARLGAHPRVIAQPDLARQHHAILQHHASGKSGLARDHAMAADL